MLPFQKSTCVLPGWVTQAFSHSDQNDRNMCLLQLQTSNGSSCSSTGRRESSNGNSSGIERFHWYCAIRRSRLRRSTGGTTTVDIASLATPMGFLRRRDFRLRRSHRVFKGGHLVDETDEQWEYVASSLKIVYLVVERRPKKRHGFFGIRETRSPN